MNTELNHAATRKWERRQIARALGGDSRAFGALYDAYAERIYSRVLYPLLGNASAAEDALSETFRVAFQKLGDYQPGEVSIYHWLARIARNKALDMHRARRLTGRALSNFETMLSPLTTAPASPEELLDGAISQEQLGVAVQATLDSINDRYRRAIELRFLQDRPRSVCAEALGVKVATFDVVLLRALRAFRKSWEAQREPEPMRVAGGYGE